PCTRRTTPCTPTSPAWSGHNRGTHPEVVFLTIRIRLLDRPTPLAAQVSLARLPAVGSPGHRRFLGSLRWTVPAAVLGPRGEGRPVLVRRCPEGRRQGRG